MSYYEPWSIVKVFELLNGSAIPYLLLRNTGDELPDRLELGKDIDILICHKNRKKLHCVLSKNKQRQIRHPLRNNEKLYGVHQFEMFEAQDQIYLDVNYEIAVRSLDRGQWVPLDQMIQLSAWEKSRMVDIGGVSVPVLGNEDLWVTTLARCVFDKKNFSPWHCQKLSRLLPLVDLDDVEEKLRLIFFKYTDRLLDLAQKGTYQKIYDDYISFKNY